MDQIVSRKEQKLTDWLTAEAVLVFYHNNAEKAKQAITEAFLDGRLLHASDECLLQCLIYGCMCFLRGWMQDPNLMRTDAKLYKLLVQHRKEESYARIDEVRSKIVPIISDKRPEARALLKQVLLGGCCVGVLPGAFCPCLHVRFGYVPAEPAASSSEPPAAKAAAPTPEQAAPKPSAPVETPAGGFTVIALHLPKLQCCGTTFIRMPPRASPIFR